MGTPTPRQLAAQVDQHVDLEALLEEYRWAYNLGYDRKVGGGVKVSGGGTYDPTHQIVASQAVVRRKVAVAARKIESAIRSIRAAKAILDEACEAGDGRHELELLGEKTVSKAEFRDAQAAKERRTARGEGYGVS